jgi:hypothetical protein
VADTNSRPGRVAVLGGGPAGMATAVTTGLRASELAGLTRADTHLDDGPHLECHWFSWRNTSSSASLDRSDRTSTASRPNRPLSNR